MFAKKNKVLYNYLQFYEGKNILSAKPVYWDYGNEVIPSKGDIFFSPEFPNHFILVDSRQYHQGNWRVDGVEYYVSCNIYLEFKKC